MAKRSKADERTLRDARRVLKTEAEAIRSLSGRLGGDFVKLVRMLKRLEGKAIVCGVGKSGHVGAKLAATLSSTGTPAVSLDPLHALHGDLGVVGEGDVLLALSHSGESAELINVVRAARPLGATIVVLTGNLESGLAREADLAVEVAVDREACPLGLAPTASTTALLAFGDALAMALVSARKFTETEFAARHPGGRLGQRLKLRVADLMRRGKAIPVVKDTASLADALREMTDRDNLGVTLVVGKNRTLVGILTDGDLRRILRKHRDADPLTLPLKPLMSRSPKCIDADAPVIDAVRLMEVRGITSLAVADPNGRPAGLLLLHDVLGRAQFTA